VQAGGSAGDVVGLGKYFQLQLPTSFCHGL